MEIKDKRIILTGATGGIGGFLASQLASQGAKLMLVDINEERLTQKAADLDPDCTITRAADITSSAGREQIVNDTLSRFSGIDILINCAGLNPFGDYIQQSPDAIEMTMQVNLLAPMLLTRLVLPSMQKQRRGHIVNIGSTFGSIGFAWFTAYSASKFGLRGFSQALRRELHGSGVHVTYVAPRAVKTAINSAAVYEMAEKVKMNFDEPAFVASKIICAMQKKKCEAYIGFPESLFARINAVLPSIVDRALKKQNAVAKTHASKVDVAV